MSDQEEKLTTIYKPNGKPLKVNQHMVACLKRGDESLDGFSFKNPKAKSQKPNAGDPEPEPEQEDKN
jgi:hypothetical protein